MLRDRNRIREVAFYMYINLLKVQNATRFLVLDVGSSEFSPSTHNKAMKSLMRIDWASCLFDITFSCILPSSSLFSEKHVLFLFPEYWEQSFPWDFNRPSMCQTSWGPAYIVRRWLVLEIMEEVLVALLCTAYSSASTMLQV